MSVKTKVSKQLGRSLAVSTGVLLSSLVYAAVPVSPNTMMNKTGQTMPTMMNNTITTPPANNGESAMALTWLQRMAQAAKQVNYMGVFVYQRGNYVETLQVTHQAASAQTQNKEQEKLETLEGKPREIIRNKDQVVCHFGSSEGQDKDGNNKADVRFETRKNFRSLQKLSNAELASLGANYHFKMGESERIAGRETQQILLEPKDHFRYAHRFWIDKATGLLLKASMLNENNQLVDQFTFTQIALNIAIDKNTFSATKPLTPMHTPVSSTPPTAPVMTTTEIGNVKNASEPSGWTVSNTLGFKKVVETKYQFRKDKPPITYLMYSDGLAAVSVFIAEANANRSAGTLASANNNRESQVKQRGAIHSHVQQVGDYRITVLGEVPAATVLHFAHALKK